MESIKQAQPSMALDQFVACIEEQAQEFESGLTVVVMGAIDMNMNPMSIAVGCARTMTRIAGSTALAQGLSLDEFEKMVRDLVNNTLEEMRPNYLKVQEKQGAAQ